MALSIVDAVATLKRSMAECLTGRPQVALAAASGPRHGQS